MPLSVLFLLLTAVAPSASEPDLDLGVDFFEGTFEPVLEQAQTVDSPLFLDLSIPECASCEFMATKVYTDTKVGEFMNARFVSFKLDAYDEEANGSAIAQRYSVGSFPTYLILDIDGNEKHRAFGSMNSDASMKQNELAVHPTIHYNGLTAGSGRAGERFTLPSEVATETEIQSSRAIIEQPRARVVPSFYAGRDRHQCDNGIRPSQLVP